MGIIKRESPESYKRNRHIKKENQTLQSEKPKPQQAKDSESISSKLSRQSATSQSLKLPYKLLHSQSLKSLLTDKNMELNDRLL